MSRAALLPGLLILFACGRGAPPPAAAAPPAFPAPEASFLCGAPEAPTAGRLVVGVLVPSRPPVAVVDLLPPGAFAEYLADEEARAHRAAPETGDASDSGEPETPEEELLEEEVFFDWDGCISRSDRLRNVAAAAAGQIGVPVLLREVTIDECAVIPLLWIGDEPRHPDVERGLRRYRDEGGLVVADKERFTEAARTALASSPFVRRLARDPLRVVEARRDGGAIVVELADTPAFASIRTFDDETLWSDPAPAAATLRFPVPESEADLLRRRLVVRWERDGLTLRRAWTLDALVGVVDRQLLASDQAVAGGTLAVRTLFFNSRTGDPVAGQPEVFRLEAADGAEIARAAATSDANGSMDVRLAVPEDATPGSAALLVGDRRFPVHVRRDYRLSVVTDRSLYRETDTVHVRLLVHRFPSGRPAEGAELKLRHVTPQGRAAERTVTASAHGIAAWTLDLQDAPLGDHHVEARLGDARATIEFEVRAFEKPLFEVTLDPPHLDLRPGELAPVTVTARFFNGAPVAGADVRAYGAVEPIRGTTDGDGAFRFRIAAEPDDCLVRVWTADGRWRDAVLRVRVAGTRRGISLAPRGDLVRGFACTFDLRAEGETTVAINDGEPQPVARDDEGRGVVHWQARGEAVSLRVKAGAEEKTFRFALADAGLRPDRRLAVVGETLGVSLRGGGSVYLDLVRDGTLVRTLAGRERIEIPLTPDLAGVLTLRAYEWGGAKVLNGGEARVLVLRGRELTVAATPEQDVYRPGAEAVVDVAVTNRNGAPVAAALGYWAVDEAVLAIRDWRSGYETVFDALPAHASEDLAAAAETNADVHVRRVLGGIERRSLAAAFAIRHRRTPALIAERNARARDLFEAGVDRARAAYVAAFAAVPVREQQAFVSLRQQLAWLVARGYLAPSVLVDPWGAPLTFAEAEAGAVFRWRSAGPDLRAGTADDLGAEWWGGEVWCALPGPLQRFYALVRSKAVLPPGVAFAGPFTNAAIGLGGGAGGGFRGRGGKRNLRAGGGTIGTPPPAPPRRDFPPTLVFVPEVLTGPDGRARLAFPLADSITTWRVRLVASGADGATGVTTGRIRVSQPLHVEPWLAPRLTEGDRIEVPVAVRNETGAPLEVDVHVQTSPPLEAVGARRVRVAVAPGGTGAAVFRIRANGPGEGEVRIEAVAGSRRDAVTRIVRVRRADREVVQTVATRLGGDAAWMPAFRAPRRGSLRLDLYPSPMADALAGFEGLIRAPYG